MNVKHYKKQSIVPISEKELLNELGIKNWRYMSKDKIAAFVNSLPRLDPEVAKAAICQFPHFSDLGAQIIKSLDSSLHSTMDRRVSHHPYTLSLQGYCSEPLLLQSSPLQEHCLESTSYEKVDLNYSE